METITSSIANKSSERTLRITCPNVMTNGLHKNNEKLCDNIQHTFKFAASIFWNGFDYGNVNGSIEGTPKYHVRPGEAWWKEGLNHY